MGHIARFLSWLGQSSDRIMLDSDCVMGLFMLLIFGYLVVDTICVIIERRKRRFTQTRRNEKASWEGYTMIQKCSAGKKRKPKTRRDLRWGCIDRTTHRHGWERNLQPEARRSEEAAPPVKAQLLAYVRRRFRELLQ